MRTTTSAFVSPVRPQHGQSRIIHGLSGCAAGAHTRHLPAVQQCQPKSVLFSAGGSLLSGCRFLLLLLGLMACSAIYAEVQATGDLTTTPNVQPRGEPKDTDRKQTRALAQTCRTEAGQAPTMVVIKPGHFQMGSPKDEEGRFDSEDSQHPVEIPHSFAISRCEITVGQFRQFVEDKDYHQGTTYLTINEQSGMGCRVWNEGKGWDWQSDRNWKNPGFRQNDDHPVVCVSWDDAQAYVAWLSDRTGAAYRLPTEAEWEYVARAGTTTARYYQDDKQCDYANGAGQETKSIASTDWTLAACTDRHVYTAPVGSYGENHFGLFDMLGNVWEWTKDCWHDNYTHAPTDGAVWLDKNGGDCSRRVVRGGSWGGNPQGLRSAARFRFNTVDANYILGFRIARAL